MSFGWGLRHLNTMPARFVAALLNPFGLTARTLATSKGIGDLGDLGIGPVVLDDQQPQRVATESPHTFLGPHELLPHGLEVGLRTDDGLERNGLVGHGEQAWPGTQQAVGRPPQAAGDVLASRP